MTKKEIQKHQAAIREADAKMSAIYNKQIEEKRELTAEESAELATLKSQKEMAREAILTSGCESAAAQIRMSDNRNAELREALKDFKGRSADNIILLSKAGENVTNTIENSGAITLRIEDLIDTTSEGLGLPDGLQMQTGVTGNEIWPVSTNDVEFEEPDEVAELNDQKLDFASITPQMHRAGLTLPVSFAAIDNAAFDLYAFITAKFQKASRKYHAKKYYWPGVLTGNKGPFSGMTKKGDITIGADTYRQILQAVAQIAVKGFEGEVVLSFDKEIEALLKCTPLIAGAAAGFVIQNGLCAGYKYTTSNYVNGGQAGKHYFEISMPEWFVIQQHGEARFTVDGISKAKNNVLQLTLNTFYSYTELSNKVNGNNDGVPQAFALYEVVEAASSNEIGD